MGLLSVPRKVWLATVGSVAGAATPCPITEPCTLQAGQSLDLGAFTVINATGFAVNVRFDGHQVLVNAPGVDTSYGAGISVNSADAVCLNVNGVTDSVQCSDPRGL